MALDPPFGADRLTRINKDMRFARDKSAPYRTHVSTVVRGNYVSLSADGLYVGTGMYMPDAPTLRRLREAIDDDASGRKLASLVDDTAPQGLQGGHARVGGVGAARLPRRPSAAGPVADEGHSRG